MGKANPLNGRGHAGRVALAADDRPLAEAVQAHLHKQVGQPVFYTPFEAVPDYLRRDTDVVRFFSIID